MPRLDQLSSDLTVTLHYQHRELLTSQGQYLNYENYEIKRLIAMLYVVSAFHCFTQISLISTEGPIVS